MTWLMTFHSEGAGMILFLDVETIPGQTEAARKTASDGVRPPGTLKKPESIAAWWANEGPAAELAAWHKQSLDGGTQGELVSIAACTDTEGQQWVQCRAQGESEAELLREFSQTVETWQRSEAEQAAGDAHYWPSEVWACAHNAQFDLGFLWRRAIVCHVPLPQWVPGPLARAGKDYGDTMTAWAGYGQRVGLDALCRALGVESPKGDMTGADVFPAWQAGECERIACYNLRDAQAVRNVWHRLQGRGLVA